MKIKNNLINVISTLLLLGFLISSGAKTTPPLKTQVFLLAGQSNMAGRGGVLHPGEPWDKIVPVDDLPDPRILRLTANLAWEEAHDPLHVDIDTTKSNGVGPGMSFANSIKEYMPGPIGLVPCAIGGTTIEEWARGMVNYKRLMSRAKVAAGYGGDIKALLWYQGESNTGGQIADFQNQTVRFFHNVRVDLNSPHLPILQVAIGNIGDGTNATELELVNKLRQAQLSIQLPNLVTVSALGLPVNPIDLVHLTSQSQVQQGHKLARAYLQNFK